MTRYILSSLGDCWIFECNSQEEAELQYLHKLGLETRREHDEFCESCRLDKKLDFKEIRF